jgi:hypothetical protein
MSWICWKEKLDPDPLTLLNPDNSDPEPCQKGRKSWCYLAELLLLDHELDLVEGEGGSGSTDPTESGSGSATLPESEEKAALYLAELLLLDHVLDLVEGEGVLLQPEVQISQPEHVVVVQDQLRLLTI